MDGYPRPAFFFPDQVLGSQSTEIESFSEKKIQKKTKKLKK
jgi:hypothetical protein